MVCEAGFVSQAGADSSGENTDCTKEVAEDAPEEWEEGEAPTVITVKLKASLEFDGISEAVVPTEVTEQAAFLRVLEESIAFGLSEEGVLVNIRKIGTMSFNARRRLEGDLVNFEVQYETTCESAGCDVEDEAATTAAVVEAELEDNMANNCSGALCFANTITLAIQNSGEGLTAGQKNVLQSSKPMGETLVTEGVVVENVEGGEISADDLVKFLNDNLVLVAGAGGMALLLCVVMACFAYKMGKNRSGRQGGGRKYFEEDGFELGNMGSSGKKIQRDSSFDCENPMAAKAENIVRKAKPVPPKQKSAWTKEIDPDSGQYYWYNDSTGESSWERPY